MARNLNRPRPEPLRAGQFLRTAGSPAEVFKLVREVDGAISSGYKLWVVQDAMAELWVAKCCFPLDKNDAGVAGLFADIRAAVLEHPNIIRTSKRVYIDEAVGVWFITMDYYPEGDLHRWDITHPDVPLREVLRIVEGVMAGLVKAHEQGILHLDIKPRNVLMSYANSVQPTPIITDFGICKRLDVLNAEPTDLFRGTISFSPIEQIFPNKQWGSRTCASDLWSVAALLFELVTGDRPRLQAEVAAGFINPNRQNLQYLGWLAEAVPVPPRLDTLKPGTPPELADMVERWLSNDPHKRVAAEPTDRLGVMSEALSQLQGLHGGLGFDLPRDAA